MKLRLLLVSVLAAICFLALWRVVEQQGDVAALRAEQKQLIAQAAAPPDTLTSSAASRSKSESHANLPVNGSVAPELLRLRSEVTRLMGRQRELSGVRGENDRLRSQLAARAANPPAALALPPGYLVRSQAKWAGFSSPDNTMQSFLWAVQNRDLTNVLAAMTPEAVQMIQTQIQRGGVSNLVEEMSHFPGFRITDRQPLPDGSVELRVQILPQDPETQPIRARLVDGQWKLDMR